MTESLCPVCLKVLPAQIRRQDDDVFLCRRCPEHGDFSEIIWRGLPDFEKWRRPKLPALGVNRHMESSSGCPFDCGLCPRHAQRPCTILWEITQKCDLVCPVCFASSGGGDAVHRPASEIVDSLAYIKAQAGQIVFQISGGEPTTHPDLVEITAAAAKMFPAVQLNTNGLRLSRDLSLAQKLKDAGLSWVFLQFDTLDDETCRAIRGRPLVQEKLKTIDNLAKVGLPTVLTPTIVKGLNDSELGALVRLAAGKSSVRGLHFQPMTSSGRNSFLGENSRLTLPELLTALGRQVPALDVSLAFPPGCEHERCSFHLRFRRLPDGTLIPRKSQEQSCCGGPPKTTDTPSDPAQTAAGRDRAVDIILRSWSSGGGSGSASAAAPAEKATLAIPMAPKSQPASDVFDEFMRKTAQETFSVTAMAFQDVWTADLERLRGCCVHVFNPPDRFVPFCAMNLTSRDGQGLHRR
jgi:uncharacterized radical SAM superfamily Fe-S cluster-containing enzyme